MNASYISNFTLPDSAGSGSNFLDVAANPVVQNKTVTYREAMTSGFEAGIEQFHTVLIALLASYLFEAGLWAMAQYFGWGEKAARKRSRWHTRMVTFRFMVVLALVTKTYFVNVSIIAM
jgi:hypothetical protein